MRSILVLILILLASPAFGSVAFYGGPGSQVALSAPFSVGSFVVEPLIFGSTKGDGETYGLGSRFEYDLPSQVDLGVQVTANRQYADGLLESYSISPYLVLPIQVYRSFDVVVVWGPSGTFGKHMKPETAVETLVLFRLWIKK